MQRILLAMLLAASLGQAIAGEGHDHDAPAPTSGATVLPRFEAHSDRFEMVGVVNGQTLTVYLDRFENNQPVTDARIQLQVGEQKLPLAAQDGTYTATLPQPLAPGLIPITAELQQGNDTDLLAGELDLHGDEQAAVATRNWRRWALPAAVGAGVIAVLALLVTRRQGRARSVA